MKRGLWGDGVMRLWGKKITAPLSPHNPITSLPSPNHDSRDGHAIDMLVLHYTGMASAPQALERLCDRDAKVSAHYVVGEDGEIFSLVDEENRAWHAGVSAWRGHTNINQRSIGIEIVNPGHEFGYRAFPKAQMQAVTALCKDIVSRHAIPARNVVAHSDVAPSRKEDPGELFDWKGLAEQGIGLWPEKKFAIPSPFQLPLDLIYLLLSIVTGSWNHLNCWFFMSGDLPNNKNKPLYAIATGALQTDSDLQAQLTAYGYETSDLPKAILAFQRHFFPERLTGVWDHECALRLATLLAML